MRITETTETKKTWKVGRESFNSLQRAEAYVERQEENDRIMRIKNALQFEVLPSHLALCKGMYWSWQDCEFGAPEVNPKRPYGNSGFATILAEIAVLIGMEVFKDADDEVCLTKEQKALCYRRHLEMEHWFQILSRFGEIPSGKYWRKETYHKWEKVEARPEVEAAIA